MTCAECREVLSARLDGEERPTEGAGADAHLAGCAACRAFAESAAHVTRLARTEPVQPVPDLVDAVFTAAPKRRRWRPPGMVVGRWWRRAADRWLRREPGAWWRRAVRIWSLLGLVGGGSGPRRLGGVRPGEVRPLQGRGPGLCRVPGATARREARSRSRWSATLRVLLGAIGIGQLGLATGDVLAVTDHEHGTGGIDGASLTHFVHESSAWNLALAVGFLGVAARPSRMRGTLPLVGAFVGVLTALSAVDVAGGRVTGSRLFAHGLVALGLLVLAALARIGHHPSDDAPDARDTDPRPGGAPRGPDRRPSAARPRGSAGAGRGPGLTPAGHRHAA